MTTEEMDFIGSMNMCGEISNEAYKKIMCHCEKTQPCEDCISREQAKDAMYALCDETETFEDNPWRDNPHIDAIIDGLDDLPSVTPQRPRGKWIEVFVETPNDPYSYGFKSHKRSKCEYRPLQISNYCPECGARMTELKPS